MARVFGTHEDEIMPIGLQKRGSTYWLRRRVPKDLIEAYGKAEVTKSLGTKDLSEAKRRLIDELYLLEREFDGIRVKLVPPESLPSERAQPTSGSRLARLRGGRSRGPSLIKTILDAGDNLNIELERRGRLPAQPPEVLPAGSAETTTWNQLAERWATERKPIAKTRQAHAAIAREFSLKLHRDAVEVTSRADVLRYKDWLVGRGISPSNLRTKLSRLKTLANYAYSNDLLSTKIVDGIRVVQPKTKPRLPFDDSTLDKLFSGPVHREGERPVQGRGHASYWLPLIAVFTGARQEEIAGLLIEDLVQLTYKDASGADCQWPFFRFISHEDRKRRLKNAGSERDVPVHPELIRLGLLRYADRLKLEGHAELFPRLNAHASGKRAHKWGQWFGGYLRNECGVTDKRVVYHSFRHSLKDACRECDLSEELQRAIMGHAARDVAGSYGSGFSRRRIIEGMAQIKVPGMPTLDPQF